MYSINGTSAWTNSSANASCRRENHTLVNVLIRFKRVLASLRRSGAHLGQIRKIDPAVDGSGGVPSSGSFNQQSTVPHAGCQPRRILSLKCAVSLGLCRLVENMVRSLVVCKAIRTCRGIPEQGEFDLSGEEDHSMQEPL